MDFENWESLKNLSVSFLDTVEMAVAIGSGGNAETAFLITNDDKVFGIGNNVSGCLGVGNCDITVTSLPTTVSSVSKKGVQGIVCGGDAYRREIFVVAYLYSGEIFCWGHVPVTNEIIGIPNLIHNDGVCFKIQVEAVVCANRHFAILTKDGQVFTGGENNYGQLGRGGDISFHNHTEYQRKRVKLQGSLIPERVTGILEDQTVIDISCGYEFTVVLLADGRVVSWGNNNYGQLGLNGCGAFTPLPSEVTTLTDYYNCHVEKITCGKNHVLVLSNSGTLYTWGCNQYGQLGTKDSPLKTSIGCPLAVEINNNSRVIDIGASYLHNVSVVQCANGKVYMWGDSTQGAVFVENNIESFETECKSVGEVFESLVRPKAMLKPMRRLKNTTTEYYKSETLPETAKKQYNNPVNERKFECHFSVHNSSKPILLPTYKDTSDLKIIVEDKELYVHRSILQMRSEYFKIMISRWLDTDRRDPIITIDGKSAAAMEAYIRYLYTDQLEVDLNVAVELMQLADEYRDENFKPVCEKAILSNLTVDDVGDVLTYTRKFENGQVANRICLNFALRHATQVMNSAGFQNWDTETMKEFMNEYVKVKGNCR